MPGNRPSLLLARAFAPARINTQDTTKKLAELYLGEAPYYSEDAPGTNTEFTPEEQEKINMFNAQFTALIMDIKSQAALGFSDVQLENLDSFAEHIKSRTYYVTQSAEFYSKIKQHLESIVTSLAENSDATIYNKPIMHELLNNIDTCETGAFSYIRKARDLLNSENSIESWLATYRQIIIEQLADEHIRRNNITERSGARIHVHNVFLMYACEKKWNPLGFQSQTALNELHKNLAMVTDVDHELFLKEFLKRYEPLNIITYLADILYDNISKKISDELVTVRTSKDYTELFSQIPLVSENQEIFFSSHDEMESEYKTEQKIFKFGLNICALRPLSEIKLFLTKYFIETNYGLFQGIHVVVNNEIAYGGVPTIADLCYVTHEDTIQQIYHSSLPIELDIFRVMETPLSQARFNDYLHDVKDFSDCILENIDLSHVPIDELNFARSKLKNVQITPEKFISLFIKKCDYKQSHFTFDKEEKVDWNDYIHWPDIDKSKLLFFAVNTTNNSELIYALVSSDCDLSSVNEDALTPIEVCSNKKNWDCVRSFAEAKYDLQGKFRFGSALIDTVKANVTEVARKIIPRVSRDGLSWYTVTDKNTSLHWAAINNNPELITALLIEGADASAVNAEDKTPIQCASENKNWACVKAFAVINHEKKNNECRYGFALYYAVINNQAEVVNALLMANASSSWVSPTDKNTCLHLATLNNNITCVKLLLHHGADAGAINTEELTPIQIAVNRKNWDIIIAFIKMQPDTTGQYRYGDALMTAIEEDKFDIAEMILQGCSNQVTGWHSLPDKNSCLHLAVIKRNLGLIKLLLQAGASLTAVNAEGHTPVDLAEKDNDLECIKIFVEKSPEECVRQLAKAIRGRDIEKIKVYVDMGALTFNVIGKALSQAKKNDWVCLFTIIEAQHIRLARVADSLEEKSSVSQRVPVDMVVSSILPLIFEYQIEITKKKRLNNDVQTIFEVIQKSVEVYINDQNTSIFLTKLDVAIRKLPAGYFGKNPCRDKVQNLISDFRTRLQSPVLGVRPSSAR